jgi:hypothetical protein
MRIGNAVEWVRRRAFRPLGRAHAAPPHRVEPHVRFGASSAYQEIGEAIAMKETSTMACEEIREKIADLRSEAREIRTVLGSLQGAGAAAAQANLTRIEGLIATEQSNLATCMAAAASAPAVDTSFVGYVGTIEAETRGTSRLWFGLLTEAQGANWLKEADKRVWLTMNMESADRPSHMAQLTLLLEAIRSGLQVKASHDGMAANFYRDTEGDSYELNGLRILRSGMRF